MPSDKPNYGKYTERNLKNEQDLHNAPQQINCVSVISFTLPEVYYSKV